MLLSLGPLFIKILFPPQCLTALVSFLPLIKSDLTHYYQKFDEDLKDLQGKNLSPRNQELVKTLMGQL